MANIYYGTPASEPMDSSAVQALTSTPEVPNNTGVDGVGRNLILVPIQSFSIPVGQAATCVCFAYPSTLRDVASVRCTEFRDTEVKNAFVKKTLTVGGVSYKVWTLTPVEGYPLANTYKVFI